MGEKITRKNNLPWSQFFFCLSKCGWFGFFLYTTLLHLIWLLLVMMKKYRLILNEKKILEFKIFIGKKVFFYFPMAHHHHQQQNWSQKKTNKKMRKETINNSVYMCVCVCVGASYQTHTCTINFSMANGEKNFFQNESLNIEQK